MLARNTNDQVDCFAFDFLLDEKPNFVKAAFNYIKERALNDKRYLDFVMELFSYLILLPLLANQWPMGD